MKKVFIIDTSLLMVWLRVPGKDTCGSGDNLYTYEVVNREIQAELQSGETLFVLPLATIIETGNHIAQCGRERYEVAQRFADIVANALDEHSPWAAFSQQHSLWETDSLRSLISRWRVAVIQAEHSLGDASIVDVAEYYSSRNYHVTIYTADAGLKSHQPAPQPLFVPRRRK